MKRYDVVVIGTGNAGQVAARIARERGHSVAVVDRQAPGGTCALRGCVPKKVLVAAAEVLDTIRRAHEHGIEVGPARLDWAKLIARERTFVADTPRDVERALARQGIELLRGRARFVGPRALDVDGARIEADHVVVATGSKPRPLAIPGAERLLTSDDLLERPHLPRSIAILGTGVIAFEFAHVFVRAGSKVTLIGRRPLAAFDPVVVARLVEATRAAGVEVHTGTDPKAVEPHGDELRVRFVADGAERAVDAEWAVNAVGRVPDLDELDLAVAGVRTGPLALDESLRSRDNPAISFAGDAVPGTPQLSPVASWEGKHAARHATDPAGAALDYTPVPHAVFSIPPLAAVGLDERAAKKAGLDAVVHENDLVGWRSARTYAEEHAFARVTTERGTGRILGANLLGHGAPEVIHTFATAVRLRWTAADLKDAVYAYPTFHADIKFLVG